MEKVDVSEFEKILNSSTNERAVATYLKRKPWILYWTLCHPGGNNRFMFSEVPLGADYRADFVILNGYSGLWNALFIELESPKSTFFNKNRTPNKQLALANQQIMDWRRFVDLNTDFMRREFCKWTAKRDLLGYSTRTDNPSNGTGFLGDSKNYISFHYYIIMGRRIDIKQECLYLKGRYVDNYGIELVTYDRLLDLAKKRYGRAEEK